MTQAPRLVPLRDLTRRGTGPAHVDGYVMAYRNWLPHPEQTVGVRLVDDAIQSALQKLDVFETGGRR